MPKAGVQFQKKDEYATPKKAIDFFGPFDYDPATTKQLAKIVGVPNFDDGSGRCSSPAFGSVVLGLGGKGRRIKQWGLYG